MIIKAGGMEYRNTAYLRADKKPRREGGRRDRERKKEGGEGERLGISLI